LRNRRNLCPAAFLQGFPDLGIHRQVLVDSKVLSGMGLGPAFDAIYQKKPAYTSTKNAL